MRSVTDLLTKDVVTIDLDDAVHRHEHSKEFVYTVPHAGTLAPRELTEPWSLDRRALLDADLHTDALYSFERGVRIEALLNRYVVNMNRPRLTRGDVEGYPDEDAIRTFLKGMEPSWDQPLERFDAGQYLALYDEYHDNIQRCIEALRERHGYAFLLTCHSMNSEADDNTPDTGRRPDITVCTEGGKAAHPLLVKAFTAVFSASTYELAVDDPYAGGYTTRTYCDPRSDIHGLQIEVNKATYMDEETFEVKPGRLRHVQSLIRRGVRNVLRALRELYGEKRKKGSRD